jgi:hypothetical protein
MSTGESFTLLSLGIIIILTRTWWRYVSVGPSNWQLDDYLMPFCAVSLFRMGPVAKMTSTRCLSHMVYQADLSGAILCGHSVSIFGGRAV